MPDAGGLAAVRPEQTGANSQAHRLFGRSDQLLAEISLQLERSQTLKAVRRAIDKVWPVGRSAGFQPAVSQCFQPAGVPTHPARNGPGNVLPIGNRRYGRLETCATTLSTALHG